MSTSKSLEDTTARLQTSDSALVNARSQIDALQADCEAASAKIDELTHEESSLRSRLEAEERKNASLQAHVTEAEALLASTNETAASTEDQLRQQLADAEKVTKDLIEQHQAEQKRIAEQYQARMAKLDAKLRSFTNRSNSGDSGGPARPQTPSSMGDAETTSGLWNMALSWGRLASRPPNATRG